MPTGTRVKAKQLSKSRVLKAGKGFEFKKVGKNRAALVRMADGSGTGVNISCVCPGGGGSCTIRVDPEKRLVCDGACAGGCGWILNVLGLSPTFVVR
jgi:hypothetical protein